MRTTALWAPLTVAAAAIAISSISVLAQVRPNAPAERSAAAAADVAPAAIPGLTDKLGLEPKRPSDLLDEQFESQVTGIAFRPPLGCKQIIKNETQENTLEFQHEDRGWLLKVTRAKLAQPMPLQTTVEKGRERTGLMDYTVQDILKDHPQAEVLRREIVNVGDNGVGIIAMRLVIANERFLRQQAIFQVSEQMYFVFNLTAKAAKTGRAEDDPNERLAVESFKAMIETIRVLDRAWIRTDQDNRLYRTRALFMEWNDKGGRRIKQAVVPEQWLRILRAGKDVGYSYIVEEAVEGKDVRNNPARAFDGVLISVRSRSADKGGQVDIGSQMFTSLDRKHEDWQHIVNLVASKGQPNEEKRQTMEFGYSEIRLRRVVEGPRDPKVDPNEKDPNVRDPRNPALRDVESYALRVERATQGRNANMKPEAHVPSPWYIPQAIGQMIPRLLPLNRPVTYLFQSYVGEQHEVILRYVDVGFEKEVTLNGQTVRAIPISDRIRLEGTPTIHYMSPDGKYLGSVNEDAKIMILPSDKATLEKIWKNPDLTRPQEVPNPASAAGLTGQRGAPSLPPTNPAAQ